MKSTLDPIQERCRTIESINWVARKCTPGVCHDRLDDTSICVFPRQNLSYSMRNKRKLQNENLFIPLRLHRELNRNIECILKGADVGILWPFVVKETWESGENHRNWMDDHYPTSFRRRESNCAHSGDKQETQPCAIKFVPFLCAKDFYEP